MPHSQVRHLTWPILSIHIIPPHVQHFSMARLPWRLCGPHHLEALVVLHHPGTYRQTTQLWKKKEAERWRICNLKTFSKTALSSNLNNKQNWVCAKQRSETYAQPVWEKATAANNEMIFFYFRRFSEMNFHILHLWNCSMQSSNVSWLTHHNILYMSGCEY